MGRLQGRYERLVTGHPSPLHRVAAGIRELPGAAESFAATQAAWRFYDNRAVTRPALAEPILRVADAAAASAEVALVVCDWSHLHYTRHANKVDHAPFLMAKTLNTNSSPF